MITVIKQTATPEQIDQLIAFLRQKGLRVDFSQGLHHTVLGLVGEPDSIDVRLLRSLDIVESVLPITETHLLSSRQQHPASTVIQVGNATFGGGACCIMAGPCAVESEEQLVTIATQVKAAGAQLLRGGAFKPRTSPYDFQGLGVEGLRLLSEAKRLTGLPVVTELMSISQLEHFTDVDIIQVGARNMQNYDLLRALGHCRKPVLLKRGPGATLNELLMSAEYLMSAGNGQIILCERGIRSFDHFSRNTLDLSAVPALHAMTHLPVIVDPSHATGRADLVPPMALAAAACGADGLLLEVHHDPLHARCDGAQALLPAQLRTLLPQIRAVRAAAGQEV